MEIVFFRMPSISSLPDLFVATDDAGSVGFGAIWGTAWFGGPWPSAWSLASITLLELFSLVVAAHVWAHRWHQLKVQFLGDNAVVVAIYIPGHRNAAADALSRLHFQEFPGPDLPIVGLQAI